jgi:hypothetical protein
MTVKLGVFEFLKKFKWGFEDVQIALVCEGVETGTGTAG